MEALVFALVERPFSERNKRRPPTKHEDVDYDTGHQ